MDSGQTRGKLFIIFGVVLFAVIIIVTAVRNKEKTASPNKTPLFQGIKDLTRTTTQNVTEYLGIEPRKVIPIETKDLEANSSGIPNVVKLSEEPTAGLYIPDESITIISPDLPTTIPAPRLISAENGTIQRIIFKDRKPVSQLFATGNTPELFGTYIGNNGNTIIARARTVSALSHYLGLLTKNTKNYCPFSITLVPKKALTSEDLEQLYGILQTAQVIPSSFPQITDYKLNIQDIIKAYQTTNTLSKKPTGLLDAKTLEHISNACSEQTKIAKRAAGEQIPEYLLSYSLLSSAIEDMIPSATSTTGALLLNTSTGISLGFLKDVSNPKTYTELFKSPFTDFNIEFPSDENVVATARPSASYVGASFMFATKNFTRTTLVDESFNLMTKVSPDGNFTLYTAGDGDLALNIIDNRTQEILTLPFVTIPDKCAWTSTSTTLVCGVPTDPPSGVEDWLRGATTNDEIKAFLIETDVTLDLPQPTEEVDVYLPVISTENNYFGFIDKKTMQPWQVSLLDQL